MARIKAAHLTGHATGALFFALFRAAWLSLWLVGTQRLTDGRYRSGPQSAIYALWLVVRGLHYLQGINLAL